MRGNAYYEVNIKRIDPPVIVSTGFIPAPLATSKYVKRRVLVTTSGGTPIPAAVICKKPITLSGNNVTIDSFDSSDSAGSTGVQHPGDPVRIAGKQMRVAINDGARRRVSAPQCRVVAPTAFEAIAMLHH